MKFVGPGGKVPERKKKEILSKLEQVEDYLALRQAVLGGRMKPMQEACILFGPEDAKRLNYKYPARVASDGLKRMLRSAGLNVDYSVVKYETDTPGIWCVKVRYEPPIATGVPKTEKKRGRGAA